MLKKIVNDYKQKQRIILHRKTTTKSVVKINNNFTLKKQTKSK